MSFTFYTCLTTKIQLPLFFASATLLATPLPNSLLYSKSAKTHKSPGGRAGKQNMENIEVKIEIKI